MTSFLLLSYLPLARYGAMLTPLFHKRISEVPLICDRCHCAERIKILIMRLISTFEVNLTDASIRAFTVPFSI